MSPANILSGILFGSVGFAVFMYGKKQGAWRPMGIGAALMVYPYFVPNTVAQIAIGALLILSLFVFHD